MDIPTLLNNLRDEVSCPVCLDILTDPRQLSCLHSFCLKCLQQWHETSASRYTIRCPKCQTDSRVPASGDVKDLPSSFYLNGLIDVLAIKECNNTQISCGNCEKKSSEASYCFQCCLFYCEGPCLISHNVGRKNRVYRVLAVKEFQDRDYEDVLKRPAFCSRPRHEKEELKFFCKNCKTAACQICFTVEHSGHALVHIEDEAEQRRTEMRNMIEIHKQNLQSRQNLAGQLKDSKAKLRQQGEDVKRQVQTWIDNLIAVLAAKKENIFVAVENQTKQSVENLTAETIKIENEIKVIQTSLVKAEKLLIRSSDIEIVRQNASLFEGTEQNKPLAHDPRSLPTVVFVKNENLMDTVKREEIGSLEISHHTKASQSVVKGKGLNEACAGVESKFNLITRDYEKSMCYNKNDIVTVEIQDEQKRDCKMGVRIHDNNNGQYQISYCPRNPGRYSISIKVNGEHVCGSPHCLLVKALEQAVISFGNLSSRAKYSEEHSSSLSASRFFSPQQGACSQAMSRKPLQFKSLLSFGKGNFYGSWGVAVSNTDEIAVTDQMTNRVRIFDSSGNYLRSFGCEGTNQGEFSSPRGICFDNNGNIFVADNGNHRIQIFTREGRYMGEFGGKGYLDSQLCYPWGLSLDTCGNIVVADSFNKLIKIFTTDGKFVRKIGGPGSFSWPAHCVQCDEYLIVSDNKEHCIKVFSREGKFQYKFGRKGGGDGEFNEPCCLAMTKLKHLIVCDRKNNRIQVFELNGEFVGKLGTKGSNLGELKEPTSVAHLSNGRIVVCEWLNNRIQIFE